MVEIPTTIATTTALPVASSPAPIQAVPTSDTSDALDARKPPRAQALVATEVQSLTQLLAVTSINAPDRPMLLMRIADSYAELRKSGVAPAAQQAIHYYTELLQGYPNFTRMDDARYFLGLEYVAANDAMNARKAFYELIKNSPSSKWVPYAYCAFGDLFFDEIKTDPSKADFAKQAYHEVLKYSASPIVAHATERLRQLP